MISLSIVVPCYNEEAALPVTIASLLEVLDGLTRQGKIDRRSWLYFVDDGSRDATWRIIADAAQHDARVRGIKLSRNRGHQIALMAGLTLAEGDALVSIDADLQDDTAAIEKMVDAHAAGHDIVYGVRTDRSADSLGKRSTAEIYYRMLRALGVDAVFNHADFRLMSRRAIEALKAYDEVNLFLRGVVPELGFPSTTVHYARNARLAGESKYPLRKMLALAMEGVTSFSTVPLRIIALLGGAMFAATLVISCWVLWVRFVEGDAVPGWASSVLPMYLLGGIQLLSIGVLGEYVGKAYLETKRRPRYFVDKIL